MVIKIAQPKYLNERGNRHNNEDSIFPLQPTEDDTLFIVCDGVGGAALGEMASQRVAATIYHYMNRYFKGFTSVAETNQLIQGAVAAAELMLSQYIMKNPTAQGMATTLRWGNFGTCRR
jgi:PPM family protein phosphatase